MDQRNERGEAIETTSVIKQILSGWRLALLVAVFAVGTTVICIVGCKINTVGSTASATVLLSHEVTFTEPVQDGSVRLPAYKETSIAYRITAAPLQGQNIVAPRVSSHLAQLMRGETLLEVQFLCSVCLWTDSAQPRQQLHYDPSTKSTQSITFRFTPVLEGAADYRHPPGRIPGVTLVVWNNGIRYDETHICVDVGTQPSTCVGDVPRRLIGNDSAKLPSSAVFPQTNAARLDMLANHLKTLTAETGEPALLLANLVLEPVATRTAPVLYVRYLEARELPQPEFLYTDVQIIVSNSLIPGQKAQVSIDILDLKLADRLADQLLADGHAALASQLRVPTGKRYTRLLFDTGYGDITKLSKDAEQQYFRLSCLMTGDSEFRQWIKTNRSADCDPAVNGPLRYLMSAVLNEQSLDPTDSSNWSVPAAAQNPKDFDQNKRKAIDALQGIGDHLYDNLFGDPNAAAIVDGLIKIGADRVKDASAKPIRVRFFSADHFPFQLVHKRRSATELFFGLVFDISSDKEVGSASQPIDAESNWSRPLGHAKKLETVFGLFTGNQQISLTTNCSKDLAADKFDTAKLNGKRDLEVAAKTARVAQMACAHYQRIARILHDDFGTLVRVPAVSGSDFLAGSQEVPGLSSAASSASLVWFFGHGATRFDGQIMATYFPPSGSGNPRLIFSDWSKAKPETKETKAQVIADLSNHGAPPVLSQGPVVVLIACEVGSAAAGGTSGMQMTDAFLQLGARGVVATEAEVDGSTASLLGERLLFWLASGPDDGGGSLALLRARRDIFEHQGGNLWPLLFYYAGAPGPYAEL